MKYKISTIIIIFLTLCTFKVQSAFAMSATPALNQAAVLSAYRQYRTLTPNVSVPTAIDVPMDDVSFNLTAMDVIDTTENRIEPTYLVDQIVQNEIPYTTSYFFGSDHTSNNTFTNVMSDKDPKTFASFPLPESGTGEVTIGQQSDPITSNSLTVTLDANVTRPQKVKIMVSDGTTESTVLAPTAYASNTIYFPQTTSRFWFITFYYDQPLRISELKLNQIGISSIHKRSLRFLAQPNNTYAIYFDPDKTVVPYSSSASRDLAYVKDAKKVSSGAPQKNPYYKQSDTDGDGLPDITDNCPQVSNADQKDINGNGKGDACEDFDIDEVLNYKDNCPNDFNPYQEDSDEDTIGDVCDKQESRFTEAHPWVPWLGIGFAGLVLIMLFALTAKNKKV